MKLLDVIWAVLRGIFWGIVDDYPFGDGAGFSAEPKESPWWEASPPKESAESPHAEEKATRTTAPGWWADPTPPTTPPTIKVETDAGTFIAATTFSGPNLMGIRRVERPRQEGESRRRRRAPAAPASPVTRADVDLRPREPEIPESAASVELQAREPAVSSAAVELRQREPFVPATTGTTTARASNGTDVAVPIDPAEAPRVARARRVRSRWGGAGSGMPRLATTLATRLELAASALSSPAPVAAREGA